jgi:RNA polymerase primary sigma factor
LSRRRDENRAIGQLLRDVRVQTKAPTHEEQVRMFAIMRLCEAQQGKHKRLYKKKALEYRNKLIEGNIRMIFPVAKRFMGNGLPYGDLLQEAAEGLMRAVERFDYKMGYRFPTYAYPWITQRCYRGVGRNNLIPVPARTIEGRSRIEAAIRKLEAESTDNKAVKDIDVAIEASVPEYAVHVFKTSRSLRPVSMDETLKVTEDEGSSPRNLHEQIPDPDAVDAEARYGAQEIKEIVHAALTFLPPREEMILKMRFGLGDTRCYTLNELSEMFHTSRERIRQLSHAAIRRLGTKGGMGRTQLFEALELEYNKNGR